MHSLPMRNHTFQRRSRLGYAIGFLSIECIANGTSMD